MQHKVGKPRNRPKTKFVGHPIEHGLNSPRAIMTHSVDMERKLYKILYSMEKHLTDSDKILVQGLAQHLTMIKLYWKHFNDVGIMDKSGRLTDAHRVFYTNWKNVIKFCNDLGLSTKAKMKLGIDWGKFKKGSVLDDYRE